MVAAGLSRRHPGGISDPGLLLGLALSLAAAACGDPLGPGNTLRLDAVIRTYFDCSVPPPPPPQDSVETPPPVGVPSYDCGNRRDTVEVSRWEVRGDLQITHVATSDAPGAIEGRTEYVAEGTVEETVCDPDCEVVFRGVTLVDIVRAPVYCVTAGRRRGGGTVGWCEGREGDTLMMVGLWLRDRPWVGFHALDEGRGYGDAYIDPLGWPRAWRSVEWSLD